MMVKQLEIHTQKLANKTQPLKNPYLTPYKSTYSMSLEQLKTDKYHYKASRINKKILATSRVQRILRYKIYKTREKKGNKLDHLKFKTFALHTQEEKKASQKLEGNTQYIYLPIYL